MIRDVTKPPYNAGRGGDDTDRIQAAIDDGQDGLDPDFVGPPNDWKERTPRTVNWGNAMASPAGPYGNIVYLPGGAHDGRKRPAGDNYRIYNVARPLRVWGNTTITGDDRMARINGRAIPRGRGLFELQHVQFGGGGSWWVAGCKFVHLMVESGGHAFRSERSSRTDPMGIFTLDNEWHSVEIVSRGSGLYFPWQYSQGNVVNGVQHRNPCYGGVAMWGNMNMIDRYRLVGGRGAWDQAQGHTSPWLRDDLGEFIVDDPKRHPDGVNPARMGMIDVRGYGNSLRMNHVEFGPLEPVVPYHFRSMDNGQQVVSLDANWSEVHPDKLVDGAYMRFHSVRPEGQWWHSLVKYKYLDAGGIHLPHFDCGYATAAAFIDADDRTFVDVGLYRSQWGAEFLPHMAIRRAFITGAYGGRMYDPNPRGPQIPYAATNGAEEGSAATFANPAPGHFVIDVTAAGDTPVKAWWQLAPTAVEAWALYSAEQSGTPNIQWWGNPHGGWGADALVRTSGGRRCAVPLKDWQPGAFLRLTAHGPGRTEFKNLSITRLAGA